MTENNTNHSEDLYVACCNATGSRSIIPAAMKVLSPNGAYVFDKILPTNSLTSPMPIWLLLSIYEFKSIRCICIMAFLGKKIPLFTLRRDLMITYSSEALEMVSIFHTGSNFWITKQDRVNTVVALGCRNCSEFCSLSDCISLHLYK